MRAETSGAESLKPTEAQHDDTAKRYRAEPAMGAKRGRVVGGNLAQGLGDAAGPQGLEGCLPQTGKCGSQPGLGPHKDIEVPGRGGRGLEFKVDRVAEITVGAGDEPEPAQQLIAAKGTESRSALGKAVCDVGRHADDCG